MENLGRMEHGEAPAREQRASRPWIPSVGAFILNWMATYRSGCNSVAKAMGLGFLTFNSGMALYRSEGDAAYIALVVFSYLDLVLLFLYLRTHEQGAGRTSARARVVRTAVWVITLLLAALFGWKMASVLPLPVAAGIWLLAGVGLVAVFNAFFYNNDDAAFQ
ncbi:hypothetical protein EJB05_55840, partial [Eragrostis curvula]